MSQGVGTAAFQSKAIGVAVGPSFRDASRVAGDAARSLGAGGDATRGYRGLWLYLAGAWADQAAQRLADLDDDGSRVERLAAEQDRVRVELAELAQTVSEARLEAAERLGSRQGQEK